jgi:hypothetical protein
VEYTISFLPRPDDSGGNAVRDCPKDFDVSGCDESNKCKVLKSVTANVCVVGARTVVGLVNYEAYKTYKLKIIDVEGRPDDKKFAVISDIQIQEAKRSISQSGGRGEILISLNHNNYKFRIAMWAATTESQ